MEADVESSRKAHENCRSQQHYKNLTAKGKCDKVESTLSKIKAQLQWPTDQSRQAQIDYVKQLSKGTCTAAGSVEAEACADASKASSDHTVDCRTKQLTFEDFFCTS